MKTRQWMHNDDNCISYCRIHQIDSLCGVDRLRQWLRDYIYPSTLSPMILDKGEFKWRWGNRCKRKCHNLSGEGHEGHEGLESYPANSRSKCSWGYSSKSAFTPLLNFLFARPNRWKTSMELKNTDFANQLLYPYQTASRYYLCAIYCILPVPKLWLLKLTRQWPGPIHLLPREWWRFISINYLPILLFSFLINTSLFGYGDGSNLTRLYS